MLRVEWIGEKAMHGRLRFSYHHCVSGIFERCLCHFTSFCCKLKDSWWPLKNPEQFIRAGS